MMPFPRRLLVCEALPVLSPLLEEQIEGWEIVPVADAGQFADHLPAHAALLAAAEDPAAMAAALRNLGLVGPLFTLVEPGETAPAPLVGLPKPLRLNLLAAKLETPNGAAVDGVAIGPWRIDSAQRALVHSAAETVERLTDREFAVLSLLLREAPAAVSRERLQTEIWNYHAEAATHTVETHVWRLRQKLEADPADPLLLLTESDGYRLRRG